MMYGQGEGVEVEGGAGLGGAGKRGRLPCQFDLQYHKRKDSPCVLFSIGGAQYSTASLYGSQHGPPPRPTPCEGIFKSW